ncbi:MAG: hypothetical protein M1433_00945 [Candidatus Parvarchaeota archaeon]|nr:hypothetical protein [Candidatus Parvarchaeota archaeon]
MNNKAKGYRVERKMKLILEAHGWKVVRAGGSLGEYDIISFKDGKCIFFQIKSTNKKVFYYYGYSHGTYESFPFKLIVDFGRGCIRVLTPKKVVHSNDGEDFITFVKYLDKLKQ